MEPPHDTGPLKRAAQQEESFGRYRLLERLGRGGMAEVFKAKSFGVEGFEKILVIKRILPELVASKRFVDLFVHEAKLAVRLSHANIVQVFDLGKVEDGPLPQYFIAMEYVAGLDLATLLSRGRRRGMSFPVGMSAYIAAEVAKGLDHAHRRRDEQMRPLGIVHRDISPQNVLLSWEGEVKVTDFGIAKARDTLDERPEDEPSGILLQGKYGYMSPEQAMGEPVDARSDIFSLGTLLYEAIAGAHPFSTGSGEETLRRVRAAEFPPLELLRPDVPKGLAEIVGKALAKDPGARYSDAGRMHEELLAFLYASAMRFGPNELSELLAKFRAPAKGVVVELGAESPEETRPHPKGEMTPTPAPIAEPVTTKLGQTPKPKAEPPRVKETPIRQGKFVGRRAELQRLGEVFALATRRKVQVVTVRGEAGIGKTRLLHEVERRLRRGQLDVAFYVIACAPNGSSHPLSGLTAMLRALSGLSEGDDLSAIEQMEPRLRALGLREEEVGAVLSQLGASRGEASMARLRSAFARMVAKLSEDQLHVFAWDNADALDAQSIEVLDGALQRMTGARAVFVLAGRGRLSHPLERLTSHHAIALSGLEDAEVEQLIASRTGLRQAPPELVAFCQERASGHPLFLEEIVRELVESQALVVELGGIARMDLENASSLPKDLESLLAMRVKRLSPKEREVLEAASILGSPVKLSLLGKMIDAPASELAESLASLEARRMIRQKGASEITFFTQVIREIVLAAIDTEARRALHREAGTAYEEIFGAEAEKEASRIALHFAEAGEQDRAADFFARSGLFRSETRQWEGAARDLSQALSLAEPSRRSAAELALWIERFAEAVNRARSAGDLTEAASLLLRRIDEEGDSKLRVASRVNLARALGAMHAFDEADSHLEAARALSDDDDELARGALVVEGELALRRGDFRKSRSCFEEASKLAEGVEAARILAGLAQSLAAVGEGEEALLAMDRADRLTPPSDLALLAENAKLRALVHFSMGNFTEAARESERAIELGRDLGLGYEVAINLHNLGDALLRLGDLPRAYASFQQSSTIFDELGQERMAAQNRGYLAYLDSLLGVVGAEKTLKESIGYASVHGYAWDEVNGRYLLARFYERAGDLASAKLELARTRELADAIGFRLVAKDCEAALRKLD